MNAVARIVETEAEFIERRRVAHVAGCDGLDSDPLVLAAIRERSAEPLAPLHPAVRAMLLAPGFMLKRQAE